MIPLARASRTHLSQPRCPSGLLYAPRRSLATGVSAATAEGDVDLSDLAGDGVFAALEDPVFFAGVYIGPSEASVGERIDL